MARVQKYQLWMSPQVCFKVRGNWLALKILCWVMGWKLLDNNNTDSWALLVMDSQHVSPDMCALFGEDHPDGLRLSGTDVDESQR